MDERTETRVMFLAAAALGLFGIFAPYRWHDMPDWITNLALLLALFLGLWAAFIWIPSSATGAKKLLSAMLIAGGICALIAGIVLYLDKPAAPTREAVSPANTPSLKVTFTPDEVIDHNLVRFHFSVTNITTNAVSITRAIYSTTEGNVTDVEKNVRRNLPKDQTIDYHGSFLIGPGFAGKLSAQIEFTPHASGSSFVGEYAFFIDSNLVMGQSKNPIEWNTRQGSIDADIVSNKDAMLKILDSPVGTIMLKLSEKTSTGEPNMAGLSNAQRHFLFDPKTRTASLTVIYSASLKKSLIGSLADNRENHNVAFSWNDSKREALLYVDGNAAVEVPPPISPDQLSLLTLFVTDDPVSNGVTLRAPLHFGNSHIWCKATYDFGTNTKFLSMYIPQSENPYDLAMAFVQSYQECFSITDAMKLQWPSTSEYTIEKLNSIPFSGRLYLYHEKVLDISQKAILETEFNNHGAPSLRFRGPEYLMAVRNQIRLGQFKAPQKNWIEETSPGLNLIEK